MRQFHIDRQKKIHGPLRLSDVHIFIGILCDDMTYAWVFISTESNTATVSTIYGLNDRTASWFVEKLLRFTLHCLQHDMGVNPRKLELRRQEDCPETLSMRRFKNTVLFE